MRFMTRQTHSPAAIKEAINNTFPGDEARVAQVFGVVSRDRALKALARRHGVDTGADADMRGLRSRLEPLVRVGEGLARVFRALASTTTLTKPVQQARHTLAAAVVPHLSNADAQGYLGISADVARAGRDVHGAWVADGIGPGNLSVNRAASVQAFRGRPCSRRRGLPRFVGDT